MKPIKAWATFNEDGYLLSISDTEPDEIDKETNKKRGWKTVAGFFTKLQPIPLPPQPKRRKSATKK